MDPILKDSLGRSHRLAVGNNDFSMQNAVLASEDGVQLQVLPREDESQRPDSRRLDALATIRKLQTEHFCS